MVVIVQKPTGSEVDSGFVCFWMSVGTCRHDHISQVQLLLEVVRLGLDFGLVYCRSAFFNPFGAKNSRCREVLRTLLHTSVERTEELIEVCPPPHAYLVGSEAVVLRRGGLGERSRCLSS